MALASSCSSWRGRVLDAGVDLDDLRVTIAVALRQVRAVALQLGDLGLQGLDVLILQDRRDGVGRRAGAQRLHLVVERFLLHQRRLGFGHGVVELVETGDHDVLAIFERQRVLLLAVAGERPLRRFDLALLPIELLLDPRQPARDVVASLLGVLRDVLARQLVGGRGCELRAGRHERDIHQPAALDRFHRDARQEVRDQDRLGQGPLVRRRGRAETGPALEGVERPRQLGGGGAGAVELGHSSKIQAPDRPARQLAAGEDPELGLIIGCRIAVVLARQHTGEVADLIVLDFDDDARLRAVERSGRVDLHQRNQDDDGEHAGGEVAVPVGGGEVVQEVGVGRGVAEGGQAGAAGVARGG